MLDTLNKIDFSNGIRSELINENFGFLERRMERERLRTAGFGVVEGFSLEYVHPLKLKIGDGWLISKTGKELFIDATTIDLEPPVYYESTEEFVVRPDGSFSPSWRPYIPSKLGLLTQDYYLAHYPINADFVIADAINPATKIKAVRIESDRIVLDALRWGGRKVRVTYKHSADRVDSVMLSYNTGSYQVERGLTSFSPSHADIEDYAEWLNIGLVEFFIEDDLRVVTMEGYRSYRPVFVNRKNVLYLNGKEYKDQPFIYFVEPETPQENDLWLDERDNILYRWYKKEGKYGWYPVNQMLSFVQRDTIQFIPGTSDYPADDQTFLFPTDQPNFLFVPGNNCLMVTIDNVPVMSDQMTEITKTEVNGIKTGIGFRLKDPLDRSTIVECTVQHNISGGKNREVFQRAAVFVDEDFSLFVPVNTEQIFYTTYPYAIGQKQLSVFVGGDKKTKDLEFLEMVNEVTPASATDAGVMSNCFKVINPLSAAAKVEYRVERWVWSYDQLDSIVKELKKMAEDAMAKAIEVETEHTNDMTAQAATNLALISGITAAQTKASEVDNCVKKTDKIAQSQLDTDVLNKMVKGGINLTAATAATILVPSSKTTDFFMVFLTNDHETRILIRDVDYTLTQAGSDVQLILLPAHISIVNNLYVTGFNLG